MFFLTAIAIQATSRLTKNSVQCIMYHVKDSLKTVYIKPPYFIRQSKSPSRQKYLHHGLGCVSLLIPGCTLLPVKGIYEPSPVSSTHPTMSTVKDNSTIANRRHLNSHVSLCKSTPHSPSSFLVLSLNMDKTQLSLK